MFDANFEAKKKFVDNNIANVYFHVEISIIAHHLYAYKRNSDM